MVMLAMPNVSENLSVARELKERKYSGKVAAIAQFDDEVEALKEAGIHAAFNFYTEAGTGFADHVSEIL